MKPEILSSTRPPPLNPPQCEACLSKKMQLRYPRQRFEYYRCQDCLHIQLWPIPDRETLENVYSQGFGASMHAVDEESLKKFASRADGDFPLKVIQKLKLPVEARILDVGCSFAYDLYAIQNAGYPRVAGVELSDVACEMADALFGIELRKRVTDWSGQYFDFIYLKHNLEHHRHPREVLAEVYSLLKPGGYLLIGVPNIHSVNGLWGKRWEWLTPPIHIHLFSRKSLTQCLTSLGMHLVKITSRRGHAMPFLKHATFYSPGVGQLASRWLGGPYNPEEAKWPLLRKCFDHTSAGISVACSPISVPLKSTFLIGEELWILSRKT